MQEQFTSAPEQTGDTVRTPEPDSPPPFGYPPSHSTKNLSKYIIVGVLLFVLVVGAAGSVAAYATGFLRLPFLNRNLEPDDVLARMFASLSGINVVEYSLNFSANTQARTIASSTVSKTVETDFSRDQERLDDIYTLLENIHAYKNTGGGHGVYFPRTLLEVVPDQDRDRISGYLDEGIYGYRQEEDGTNFMFAVQLETEQAFNELSYLTFGLSNSSDQIIVFNKDIPPFSRRLTIQDDSSLLNYYLASLPADLDFRVGFSGYNKNEKAADKLGKASLGFFLKMDGSTFEADGDLVWDNEAIYVRVNEFPALGFFSISPLLSKWIKIDFNDISETVGQEDISQDLIMEHYSLLLETILENNVIVVNKENPKVELADRMAYHYEIDIKRENLAAVYESYVQEAQRKFGDDSLVEFDRDIYEGLKSQEFLDYFDEVTLHTAINLWVDDRTFHPLKISFSTLFVPPDTAVQLRDKQIKTEISFGLNNINKPVDIEIPTEFMTVEEAENLLYGGTLYGTSSIRGIIDRAVNSEEE